MNANLHVGRDAIVAEHVAAAGGSGANLRVPEATDLLKALAHESRLEIVALLADRERSVSELEELLDLRQPAVSQQLARLRADNLVATRREGKQIYYSVVDPSALELAATIKRLFPAGPGAVAAE